MLHRISKKTGSLREINKINKTMAQDYKKRRDDSSNYFSDELDSDSSLSSDSNWDEHRRPAGRNEINRLDHVVTDNIKRYTFFSNIKSSLLSFSLGYRKLFNSENPQVA